jgi:nucleotide-binding universal stress UspA family protein
VKQVLARGIAAAPVILDYARKEGAGLIVIGTHGRRGLRRYMLGSVAEEVLAEADIPVLAVREGTAEQHRAVQRVLVPVDLSDLSEPLVREAAAFCEPFGAHVDLVNVVEPLPLYVSAVGGVTLFDLVPNVVEETREELRRLAERAVGPRLPVEAHVVEGDAPREIVKLAESLNSDLIVMTRQSLTHLERLIMGSVTARVLRSAPCPVLVVPTPEPSEPPADS